MRYTILQIDLVNSNSRFGTRFYLKDQDGFDTFVYGPDSLFNYFDVGDEIMYCYSDNGGLLVYKLVSCGE